MVDPQPDIEPYLEAAAQKGMRITHIFETHVQADHLSGARRLAAVSGAPVLYHESADVRFPHVDVEDGEEHELGNVRVTVLHTPGHTPDSMCLLVTDRTRAQEPWFVLTGDTLFVGAVGRPDLAGREREMAAQLHDSVHERLLRLPSELEIYPGHQAGSACGAGLSGKPTSTIGFERRCNPMLSMPAQAFVDALVADIPPPPAEMNSILRHNLGQDR